MKLALVAIVVGALFVATAGIAFAHAEPDLVVPGDGAVLREAPAEIVLMMSQDMFDRPGSNDIDVLDAAGKEVTTVAAAVDRNDRKRLSVAVPTGLAPGTYSVKWKTLSADDGDPAEGSLSFTYDPNGTADPGKTKLREDSLGTGNETPVDASTGPPALAAGGSDTGVTWILVVAVGIGMFVLGAGGTFLLVQKRT